MAKINLVHALGGGILAGVIINVSGGVAWQTGLGKEYLRQLGGSLPSRTIPLAIWWGLLMGIVAVWAFGFLSGPLFARASTAALPQIVLATLAGAALYDWAGDSRASKENAVTQAVSSAE